MSGSRRAPVQAQGPYGHGSVAWEEHETAWKAYSKRFGNDQSAARIADRGGFGYEEMIGLLGHQPRTWRPSLLPGTAEDWKRHAAQLSDDLKAQRAEAEELLVERDAFGHRMAAAEGRARDLAELLHVLVYWHDQPDGHIDESWWDAARELLGEKDAQAGYVQRDAQLVALLRAGWPCALPGGDVYGPYLDALNMVADAIERGEHVK